MCNAITQAPSLEFPEIINIGIDFHIYFQIFIP